MKLKDMLKESELNKVKLAIDKELKKESTSFLHNIKLHNLKDYSNNLKELSDTDDLKNICSLINDKNILIKIQKHIENG